MKNLLFIILLAGISISASTQSQSSQQIITGESDQNHSQFEGMKIYKKTLEDTLAKMLYGKKILYKTMMAGKQKMDSLTEVKYDESTYQMFINYKYSFVFDEQENQIRLNKALWSDEQNRWMESKEEFTYDPNGNMIQRITFSWKTDINQWIFISKEDFSYDGNENLIQHTNYLWHDINSAWIPQEKTEYAYDSQGNKLSETISKWNADAIQWTYYFKQEFDFDTANQLIRLVYSFWILPENQWIENFKREYSFDMSGNLTLYTYFVNYEFITQWQGNLKEEYAYDPDNNLTLSISYDWDEATIDWKENFNNEYTYNVSGQEILWVYHDWDELQNLWVALTKVVTTIDTNGNKSLFVSYDWSAGSNQWEEYSKGEFSYDSNNFELQMAIYNWNAGIVQWTPYYKVDKLYDEKGNLTDCINWNGTTSGWELSTKNEWTFNNTYIVDDLVLPSLVAYDYADLNYMLTGYKYLTWHVNSNSWRMLNQKDYFYSELSLTDITEKAVIASLFPNPAKENIEVSIPGCYTKFHLDFYDINGQIVLSSWLQNNQKLSVKHLPSGTYTYKISCLGKIHSGKLLKL